MIFSAENENLFDLLFLCLVEGGLSNSFHTVQF